MAAATPRPSATPLTKPAPKARAAHASAKAAAEDAAEWWVAPLRWAALVIFIAVPAFAHMMQSMAGRVVWTMAVASLPLFIVLVGYHRWRRICPLAFFAQIPVRLRRPGTKKASVWLEANYYYVSFAVFFVSLWLRLIATNGDGHAITAFFVLISLAALIFGAFYTGKTWCNYICPVSFIEKIYTEPHGLRETRNSQCAKCTACKKFCPDINEENGYWKEIESQPKKFAYFFFPGLVFGFYFYYYLQAGTWDYYYGGSWTNEPM
ncbi:MAG TPA: 4Fe-4S binding protein, partial [Pyrinomonadaceae bacterium]